MTVQNAGASTHPDPREESGMNDEGLVAEVGPRAAGAVVNYAVKEGTAKWLAEMGTRHVTKTFTDAYVRDLAQQAAKKGAVSVTTSLMKASGEAAAARATVNALVPVAGRFAGGALAGPVVEVAALRLDGDDHTMDEYAEAAGRGFVSGVVGVAAGAAAGAAVGSVVPILGTAVGFVAGAFASSAMSRKLKRS